MTVRELDKNYSNGFKPGEILSHYPAYSTVLLLEHLQKANE